MNVDLFSSSFSFLSIFPNRVIHTIKLFEREPFHSLFARFCSHSLRPFYINNNNAHMKHFITVVNFMHKMCILKFCFLIPKPNRISRTNEWMNEWNTCALHTNRHKHTHFNQWCFVRDIFFILYFIFLFNRVIHSRTFFPLLICKRCFENKIRYGFVWN